MLDRLQRGMGGAQAFVLNYDGVRGGFAGNRIHVRTEHHDDLVERRLATGEQMAQHRTAGDFMQGLGQIRSHPGAQTSGEENGGCFHENCLLR